MANFVPPRYTTFGTLDGPTRRVHIDCVGLDAAAHGAAGVAAPHGVSENIEDIPFRCRGSVCVCVRLTVASGARSQYESGRTSIHMLTSE